MLTKRKSRIVTTILAVAILATMFAGFASATEAKTPAPRSAFYSFRLSLPAYGETDMATAREKVTANDCATFKLGTVVNNTGYECFLNVRNKNGDAIAGYPEGLGRNASGSIRTVAYRVSSGFGKIGESYRPSGQTYSLSPTTASISGEWEA